MTENNDEDQSEPESFEAFLRSQTEKKKLWHAINGENLEARGHALLKMSHSLALETMTLDQAISYAGAAADVWRELWQNDEALKAYWHMGDCLLEAERYPEAISAYTLAIEVGDEILRTRSLMNVHYQLARCYTKNDQDALAEEAAVKAAELALQCNMKMRAQRSYQMASGSARADKRWVESATYCDKAIAILKQEDSAEDLAEAYARKAQNLIDLKRFSEAGDCLDRARNLMRLTNMDWLSAGLTFHRARLWLETGMAAESIPLFDEALQGAKDKSAPQFAAEVMYCRAKAYLEIGVLSIAREEFETLITLTSDGFTALDAADLSQLLDMCRPQPVLFEIAS